MTLRTASWAAAALLVGAAAPAWGAEGPSGTVHRCPGNPVLYTDQLTPKQAQEKGCRTIENAPITVMQSARPRTAVAPASRPEGRVVPAADQRARDDERRTILEAELRRDRPSACSKAALTNRQWPSGSATATIVPSRSKAS